MSAPRSQLDMSAGTAAVPPAPSGFGHCESCAYLAAGSPAICFGCSTQSLQRPLGPSRCVVCELELGRSGRCVNSVCGRPGRGFGSVRAVYVHSAQLRWALHRYKGQGHRGWAEIFGRLLVGYLRERRHEISPPDLLVGCPTYVGPGGRAWDHIGLILAHASERLGREWPLGPRVIVKDRPTQPLKHAACRSDRHRIARLEIRPSLRVPDPTRVGGRSVLVFDDVFTEGLTLHEVGCVLRRAGAIEVRGLVLARQPYRQPPGPRAIRLQP